MAFGWIGATSAFASVVRKADRSQVTSPSLALRTEVQFVQIPTKWATDGLLRHDRRCAPIRQSLPA